jgi:hypothetical protein
VRSKLIALAGATMLLAGACSGDDDSAAGDRDSFMSQCTGASEGAGLSDAEGYCGCIYDGLADSLSADELEAVFSATATDQVPPEATDVITECATSAITLPGTTVAP